LVEKDQESDSIAKPLIEDFGQYSVYNSGDKKTTMAWNDSHLVVFGLTKRYSYNDYAVTTAVDSVAVVSDSSPVIIEEPYEQAVDTAYADYPDNYYANYQKEQTAFDSIQSISQNRFIKLLFENGFIVPTSDKVHENADISC